jgi:hypothetical protein
VVGAKFSRHDRKAINLSRHYSLQPVEYCRNFIFRRNFPIPKLYQRSCDRGWFRLTADRLSHSFAFRLHKRLPGKLATAWRKSIMATTGFAAAVKPPSCVCTKSSAPSYDGKS